MILLLQPCINYCHNNVIRDNYSIWQWQLFISQIRLIKTYGPEGMRETFSLVCVHNDQDSADYILGTTAQSEAAKVAK